MTRGMVYLVGAGPGDPELITLRALDRIKRAEVIVYDYLANAAIMDHASPSAERIYVGKQAGRHALPQEEINLLLIRLARENKIVVRLKGGDPYIFGRGGEEASELQAAGIPFEVVPGVTSAIAVPSFAGIPLTDRRWASSVAFITGHEDPTKPESSIRWDRLATGVDTLVFLMGVRNLPDIAGQLVRFGRPADTPVAVIYRGSTPEQRTVTGTLDTIVAACEKAEVKPPSIIVVGRVVSLRDQLNWFERRPLFGRTILVTRARQQASEFTARLEEYGAECILFPTIETAPPGSWDEVDLALNTLSEFSWLLFTSVNGVHYFFDRIQKNGQDVRVLHGLKIGAIGPATADAIQARGLRVDFMPSEYRAEGIIEELRPRLKPGEWILIPRAKEAREILPQKLAEAGAKVHVVTAYETVMPSDRLDEVRRRLKDHKVDMITFTSSSTVTNFIQMFEPGEAAGLLEDVIVACIGPITAETARKHGLRPRVQPEAYTIDDMVDAILEFFLKVPT
ncbi:MAG: uroporphyrinogen-III C-methyltransferase [Deltaproteobacteria bacterium]|nr:uroporphyrinogen-III C-methyltransferase [Deltaproteobacteria bacterium]